MSIMRRLLLLVVAGYLVGAGSASAHPLDALLHDLRLRVRPDQITLHGRIVVGPLVAARLWDEADRDGDGRISQAEAAAWGQHYLEQVELLLDGSMLPLALDGTGVEFPAARAEFVSDSSGQIFVSAAARLPSLAAGEYVLETRSSAYAEISVYDFKALGGGGVTVREAMQVDAKGARFPLLVGPRAAPALEQSEYIEQPGAAEIELQPLGDSKLLERLRAAEAGAGFLLVSLLAALLFGALHALQPGHGKTLVAAYLVGSRGTVRHAIALGGIVTFTHTASVLLLGALLLAFTQVVKLEQIIPGLTALSGLLVVGIGLNLFWGRLRGARRSRTTRHHSHASVIPAHQHDHAHEQHHGHDHHEDHEHHHSHALPERITARSLIALGVSGGIVPCTEALVILIVAVTLGRLLLGLLLIIAFSIGLASVLIAIGIALVTMGSRLVRTPLGRLAGARSLAQWVPVVSAALVTALGAALAWQGLAGL